MEQKAISRLIDDSPTGFDDLQAFISSFFLAALSLLAKQTHRSNRRVTEPLWRARLGSPKRLVQKLLQVGDGKALSAIKGLSAESYSAEKGSGVQIKGDQEYFRRVA
uniref:Uncharacterized protein n=1 Tax=Solanum tuberosum TaxID=4113 RepID=M1E0A7_SOLTU